MSPPLDLNDVLCRFCAAPDPVEFLSEFLRAEATEADDVAAVLVWAATDEINARRAAASSG